MTPDEAAALRAPFDAEQIGKLPKPTRKDNPKGSCDVCGGYHGLPAVHLDYVGHAATTDRLLAVDPEWTWRPMAKDSMGLPLVLNGGLWIELTVCGVTRPGFGDSTGSGGMKEMIGDAIRNAAMRFGVALDLWSKQDLAEVAGEDREAAAPAGREGTQRRGSVGRSIGNPGRQLLASAIAVTDEASANSLREAQLFLDPAVNWALVEEALALQIFTVPQQEMKPDQWGEFWTRLANAVVRAQEMSGGDFPPPTREQTVEAYAWAFGLEAEAVGAVLSHATPPTTGSPADAVAAAEEAVQRGDGPGTGNGG